MKLITILPLFTALTTNAQTNNLRYDYDIILPKDSTTRLILINALNGFLTSAQKPNEKNSYVYPNEKLETSILLDEMNEIEQSKKFKDNLFYKPYLTNVVPLPDSNYLIQLSYLGTHADSAFLAAGLELIAHRAGQSFLFSSPLAENTKKWKVKKIGNIIFHYQNTINKAKTKAFRKQSCAIDRKLKIKNKTTEYFCCDNLQQSANLAGIAYKAAYNGLAKGNFSALSGDKKLVVLGDGNASFDHFDPHDLFHDRLSLAIARTKVNKPVDEGCAYLYGGSWSLSWKEIFRAFKEQIAVNKNTSWSGLKETPVYFKTNGFKNSADYIVNALLVQKIEKEKGFTGVWELLTVGPYQKGNANYYSTLEKLTGITRENYNSKIWELVNSEK